MAGTHLEKRQEVTRAGYHSLTSATVDADHRRAYETIEEALAFQPAVGSTENRGGASAGHGPTPGLAPHPFAERRG